MAKQSKCKGLYYSSTKNELPKAVGKMATVTHSVWQKAQSYYTHVVEEHAARLRQDHQLVFGGGLGMFGVFLVLFGLNNAVPLSMMQTPLGLGSLLLGLLAVSVGKRTIHSAV